MNNSTLFYINGEWVKPHNAKKLSVINPSTEAVFATISLGGEADTNDAVAAAKNAFAEWSQTSKAEKLGLFKRLRDIYQSRLQEMGDIISQEMGSPIDQAIHSQAQSSYAHLNQIIPLLESFEFTESVGDSQIYYEPIGVCALITPWNWPMNQITLKVLPALAVGCTMVLKPSEIAPLSALKFAEMIDEAGFPKGVFNLINGDGENVGSQLSKHPDVDMVSFTGSTRAGRLITKNAAEGIKRVSLELGGKGANIVFADAGAKAVSRGVHRCFGNSGQSCNAPTRMLVERSYYSQAVAIAKEVAANYLVDEAAKTGKHIGPVVSKVQYDKIQNLIQQGIDEGSELLCGGTGRPEHLPQGYFVKPTVFADVNNQMTIAREEVFGPVLSLIPFENEQQAIAIANDTPYGLTNYIQTSDSEKAIRVAKQLRSGMVEINGVGLDEGTPFGGYKQSGNGREGGIWGIKEFLEVKAVSGA